MAPLTLPLTFSNSFWSQDYRAGLQVLYTKLEQGTAENDEIVNFVQARIRAERDVAAALTNPPLTGPQGAGFGADDGASLLMAFRGLQHESTEQGKAHLTIANDLQDQVAQPFEAWAYQHADRIQASKTDLLDTWLGRYEEHIHDVNKVREEYLTKCRKADEAEDDAKFAPNNDLQAVKEGDPERLSPHHTIRRTPSVAERISERLKSLSRDPSPSRPPNFQEPKNTIDSIALQNEFEEKKLETDDSHSDGTVTPKLDKGKGKEVSDSPQALSPVDATAPNNLSVAIPGGAPAVTVTTHIVFGESSLSAADVSALLFRAQQEIGVRVVKYTLLGEYEHCFNGEEFVVWLKNNVEGLKGSLDWAEDAARLLTEDYGALRRIGQLGNTFDNKPDAFYQFRPKAFNLQAALQRSSQDSTTDSALSSPVGATAKEGLKRSGTMVSYFVKAVQNATAPGPPEEPPFIKAKREATAADTAYRKAVKQLDQHRCAVEERIDETLKALQRWELDRLKAVKTVLLQYQGIIASLNGSLASSNENSSILISSFMPESDIKALIERYRTGPFRPEPKIYESITHETDGSFGIDLRKWAGEGAFSPVKSVGSMDEVLGTSPRDIPPVLVGLLTALRAKYGALENDGERRRSWIYEVPLPPVHQLRATLNSLPFDMKVEPSIFEHFDPPVLASVVKLWLLELNPPVTLWESWDEVKKLYPTVGASEEGIEKNNEEELKALLIKLPLVGLKVLDALLKHLKELIDTTTTEESNDVYITKLSLSVGRAILRPRQETSLSIQSHQAYLFFADLIKHYEEVLPAVIDRKRQDLAQRAVPIRKRTKLVDARAMRRSIDISADPKKLLEAQFMLKNPTSRPSSPNPQGSGGRPAFVSPPSSPPAAGNVAPLPIITGGGDLEATEKSPGVAIAPPSPVNLNEKQGGFVPPPPPPPIVPAPAPAPVEDDHDEPFVPPTSASSGPSPVASSPGDAPLSSTPSSLHRTGSTEANRVRGPRVAARGGGPRPPVGGAGPPTGGTRVPFGRGGSPRNSFSSPGRVTSPTAARPRTPPDSSQYLPTKRGGRAPAGSFSRTRPEVD